EFFNYFLRTKNISEKLPISAQPQENSSLSVAASSVQNNGKAQRRLKVIASHLQPNSLTLPLLSSNNCDAQSEIDGKFYNLILKVQNQPQNILFLLQVIESSDRKTLDQMTQATRDLMLSVIIDNILTLDLQLLNTYKVGYLIEKSA